MIEDDGSFFLEEVHIRADDGFIDLVQVLQQPDAGAAMDFWNVKCDVRLVLVLKPNELASDLLIIQVIVFA